MAPIELPYKFRRCEFRYRPMNTVYLIRRPTAQPGFSAQTLFVAPFTSSSTREEKSVLLAHSDASLCRGMCADLARRFGPCVPVEVSDEEARYTAHLLRCALLVVHGGSCDLDAKSEPVWTVSYASVE